MASRNKLALCCAIFFAFALTFILGIWNNDFPFYYHVDEPGKARQILTGERNLHHPLLMLSSADLIFKTGWIDATPQAVVHAGRTLSAFFNAGAAALLTWILGASLGTSCAWIGAFLIGSHWNVFELSHYFKEDPALSFGILFLFAAIAWWQRRQNAWSAALIGVGLALAISGKYLGVMVLPFVVWAWVARPPARWLLSLFSLIFSFGLALLLINFPMFLNPDVLAASLQKETTGALKGGEVATHSWFHPGFLKRIFHVSRVALIPGLIFLLIFGLRKVRQWPLELLMLSVFPLFLAILLGFSQKDSGRYFLPGVFGLAAASTLGWWFWIQASNPLKSKAPRLYQVVSVLAVLATLVGAGQRLRDYAEGFQSGSREKLSAWIAQSLPLEAVIIQSEDTKLPDPNFEHRESVPKNFPQKIITVENLSRDLTLEQVRAMGATHLAATESEWRSYLKGGKVREGKSDTFQQRRTFWKTLQDHGELVFETPAGKVGTHHPPIRLWKLPES